MNQASRYIFNLYHYLLNFRDTLEFALNREHTKQIYDQRKFIIENGIKENTPLGNFFAQNKENEANIKQLKEGINNVIDELYSDDSNVISVSNDVVRVDHTQHTKIYELVIPTAEKLRDVVYGYINFARGRNELENDILDLVKKDEVLYRTIVVMLLLSDYIKSFQEFQKVMSESGGKPTPQSNYIVQNELLKLAGLIRSSRFSTHATDNTTLDLLDKVNQIIEMCEGRRDRRDNKSFGDLFKEVQSEIQKYLSTVEPVWKNAYDKVLKEVIELDNKNRQNNSGANVA